MSENYKPPPPDAEVLWRAAQAGGPGAALAARRVAALWEKTDPSRAQQALALAVELSPLEPGPRLGLARLAAEAGDVAAAKAEAQALLDQTKDPESKTRAAVMLGDLSRAEGATEEARSFYTQRSRPTGPIRTALTGSRALAGALPSSTPALVISQVRKAAPKVRSRCSRPPRCSSPKHRSWQPTSQTQSCALAHWS
jgi:hypothetical protein